MIPCKRCGTELFTIEPPLGRKRWYCVACREVRKNENNLVNNSRRKQLNDERVAMIKSLSVDELIKLVEEEEFL